MDMPILDKVITVFLELILKQHTEEPEMVRIGTHKSMKDSKPMEECSPRPSKSRPDFTPQSLDALIVSGAAELSDI